MRDQPSVKGLNRAVDPTQKYNLLSPVIPLGKNAGGRLQWLFLCDCGRTKAIRTDYVIAGRAKSCGCYYRRGIRTVRNAFREKFLLEQDNKCAICKSEFLITPDLDHDHRCCPQDKMCAKCVRGLLCETCNRGLGMFKDSIDLLKLAVEYLGRFQ
jgi:hypothetical protein